LPFGPFWPLIGIAGGGGGVTGGIIDGTRSSEPVQAGRFGQSRIGWKTAATSARSSVSLSNNARTRSSSTSRFSVIMSNASWLAVLMSFETS